MRAALLSLLMLAACSGPELDAATDLDAPDLLDAAPVLDAPDLLDAAPVLDAPDLLDAAPVLVDAAPVLDAPELLDAPTATDAPDPCRAIPDCHTCTTSHGCGWCYPARRCEGLASPSPSCGTFITDYRTCG